MNSKFSNELRNAYNKYVDRHDLYNYLSEMFPELSRECIRSRVRRFAPDKDDYLQNKNISKDECIAEIGKPITNSVEYKADGSAIFERIIAMRDCEQLTPDNVLSAHGMDTDMWELVSCKSNFYQQQKKGGEILNLYQSKITARPLTDNISFNKIKENFNELMNTFTPIKVGKPSPDAHYLYEINIADLHLGKFCTEEETGDFLNSELAEKRFFEVIDNECRTIEKYGNQIEKILFVWTNDFFNSDGISNATTGGTPQDTDTKWQKLYLTGREQTWKK